jgi:cAMP-dependent protein kinase regulator
MASLFSKKKKKDVDITNLLDLIKQNPNNANNYLMLGQLYLERTNKEKGIENLFKAAELFTKEAFISKAIAIYKKIQDIDPHNAKLPATINDTHRQSSEIYSDSLRDSEKSSLEAHPLIFQSELFSSLDNSEFHEFIKKARVEKFIPGQLIISEGESGDSMYIILSGKVKVLTKSDGMTIELGYLEEKDFFGEVSILTEKPRTATIIGITNGELLALSKKDLQTAFAKYPAFQRKVEEFYQKRVYNTIDIFLKKLK